MFLPGEDLWCLERMVNINNLNFYSTISLIFHHLPCPSVYYDVRSLQLFHRVVMGSRFPPAASQMLLHSYWCWFYLFFSHYLSLSLFKCMSGMDKINRVNFLELDMEGKTRGSQELKLSLFMCTTAKKFSFPARSLADWNRLLKDIVITGSKKCS